MTICMIDRNDAENRLAKIIAGSVDPGADLATITAGQSDLVTEADVVQIDIEDVGTDGIRTRLVETFQSHPLAELTAAVLRTRDLTCVVSPPLGRTRGLTSLPAAVRSDLTHPGSWSNPRAARRPSTSR